MIFFFVDGMTCEHCVEDVRGAILSALPLKDVTALAISLDGAVVGVGLKPKEQADQHAQIVAAIEAAKPHPTLEALARARSTCTARSR